MTTANTSSLASHKELWSLDALGNWSSSTTDSSSAVSRTHNTLNEVTAVGSASLTFDNNGNTLTDQNGFTYTYDAWNRVMKATPSGTTYHETFYTYDGLGRRISELDGLATSAPSVVLAINDGSHPANTTKQGSMVTGLTLLFQSPSL